MKFFLNFVFVLLAVIIEKLHSQSTTKDGDKAKTKTYKELEIEDYVCILKNHIYFIIKFVLISNLKESETSTVKRSKCLGKIDYMPLFLTMELEHSVTKN